MISCVKKYTYLVNVNTLVLSEKRRVLASKGTKAQTKGWCCPYTRVSQNFKHENFIWDQADSYSLRKRNAEKCENHQNQTTFKGSY